MNETEKNILRHLVRETLRASDVAASKRPIRSDVKPNGMSEPVKVQLGTKTWLTSSQAEINRVISKGGRIVKQ